MTLGPLIHLRREQLGLSMEETAKRAGISKPAVSYIENGQKDIKVSTLVGLSRALRISKRKLFDAAVETVETDPRVVDYMKGDTSG